MQISSSNQAYVFLSMIFCGALCTVVFDLFRALRRFKKSSNGIIALQDVVFWGMELIIVYVVAFKLNYAKVRAYEIIALVMGSLIYFVTLSEYVIGIFCKFMDFAVKIISKLLLPFVKLARLATKPFMKMKIRLSLKLRKLKKNFVAKIKKTKNKIAARINKLFTFARKRKKEDKECKDSLI